MVLQDSRTLVVDTRAMRSTGVQPCRDHIGPGRHCTEQTSMSIVSPSRAPTLSPNAAPHRIAIRRGAPGGGRDREEAQQAELILETYPPPAWHREAKLSF